MSDFLTNLIARTTAPPALRPRLPGLFEPLPGAPPPFPADTAPFETVEEVSPPPAGHVFAGLGGPPPPAAGPPSTRPALAGPPEASSTPQPATVETPHRGLLVLPPAPEQAAPRTMPTVRPADPAPAH